MFLKPSNRTRIVYEEKYHYFDHMEALWCNIMVSHDLIEIQLKRSHSREALLVSNDKPIWIDSHCELILGLYVSFTILFLDICQFGADIPTLT